MDLTYLPVFVAFVTAALIGLAPTPRPDKWAAVCCLWWAGIAALHIALPIGGHPWAYAGGGALALMGAWHSIRRYGATWAV